MTSDTKVFWAIYEVHHSYIKVRVLYLTRTRSAFNKLIKLYKIHYREGQKKVAICIWTPSESKYFCNVKNWDKYISYVNNYDFALIHNKTQHPISVIYVSLHLYHNGMFLQVNLYQSVENVWGFLRGWMSVCLLWIII